MQTIHELERLGFSLWLGEGNIKYRFQGKEKPDPSIARFLLKEW